MSDIFNKLQPEEKDLLFKGPLFVNILIAGADGKIDNKERKAAFDFIQSNSDKLGNGLGLFYYRLTENLNLNYTEIIQSLPRDFESRNKEIVRVLGRFTQILQKLDRQFAIDYYQSLRKIAEVTAKASGGVLGFGSISQQEQKYLLLPMIINPEVQEEIQERKEAEQ